MSNIAMITNASGLTLMVNGGVHTIAKDHPNFLAIQEAVAENDPERAEALISVKKAVETYAAGTNLRIENGKMFYGDREIKTGLARRIIKMIADGQELLAKPLVAFMNNVLENPSYRAVEGLYEWLEKSNLPITPDGHFIAWKIVDPDYTDCRTNTFDNSVGCVVQIARNEVDENPDRTCSAGLHFCSNEYLPHYGNSRGRRIMMVKVNPRDVGAFPRDYNTAKGRCCRYEVVEEVTEEEANTKFTNNTSSVYQPKQEVRQVDKLDTRGDRAEITLVFRDGSKQLTKNRLGDTTSFSQKGDVVTLLPSGRTILID